MVTLPKDLICLICTAIESPPKEASRPRDLKTSKPVGVSTGKCIEHYLVETVDRLKVVREAMAGGWNAAKRFRELQECLRGDALESYKKLARKNYPDPADKTNANCKELVRLIPTNLRDRPYPGNKVRHYFT